MNPVFSKIFGNNILLSDSYKVGHYDFMPYSLENLKSYFSARGVKPGYVVPLPEVVFFGLQYLLDAYYAGEAITKDNVIEAKEICNEHLKNKVFNEEGWMDIVNRFGGRLPISIEALPEGLAVPLGTPMYRTRATDKRFAWLPGYLETHSVQLWYPCTIASCMRSFKQMLRKFAARTYAKDGVNFKVHDFGVRGVTCMEQAAIGGSAHMTQFYGTDNLPALSLCRNVYEKKVAGISCNATEHSVMCLQGEDGELERIKYVLARNQNNMVACVGDTYNIYRMCRYVSNTLREEIMNRKFPFVVRPDSSGRLASGVVEEREDVLHKCQMILWEGIGGTVDNGFRRLHPNVRLLWGDGIDYASTERILEFQTRHHWSLDNYNFGAGTGILQNMNRDTMGYAQKAYRAEFVEEGNVRMEDVFKSPLHGGKQSLRGEFKVVQDDEGKILTVAATDPRPDLMQEVFRDGEVKVRHSLDAIRERCAA